VERQLSEMRVRGSALLPGVVFASVVALVLLAPLSSASGSVVYSAPYLHSKVLFVKQSSKGGCSFLSAGQPRFNSTTGVGTYEGHATAKTCSTPPSGLPNFSYGAYLGGIQLLIPIKALGGAATKTSVVVWWNISVGESAGIALHGSCPKAVVNATTGDGVQNCDLSGYGNVTASAYLEDLTNGTVFPASRVWFDSESNFTYDDTVCHSFKCQTHLRQFGTAGRLPGSVAIFLSIRGTLNHADRYVAVTTIYASGNASVYCYPSACFQGSSAFSHMWVTPEQGHAWNWTLRSITVS
jgi:hypothetical protein